MCHARAQECCQGFSIEDICGRVFDLSCMSPTRKQAHLRNETRREYDSEVRDHASLARKRRRSRVSLSVRHKASRDCVNRIPVHVESGRARAFTGRLSTIIETSRSVCGPLFQGHNLRIPKRGTVGTQETHARFNLSLVWKCLHVKRNPIN